MNQCWSACMLWSLAACSAGPRTVAVDLAPRSSCGWSTASYNLSCVASLDVRVVDGVGAVQSHRCLSVANQYQTLADLVTPTATQDLLSGIAAKPHVRIEVRGYFAMNAPPCEDLSDSDLMFWGSSDWIDLNDSAVSSLVAQIECRPDCDCAAISLQPTTCPVALAAGICAPPSEVLCRQSCLDGDVCYDLLSCQAGVCATQPGDLCADCSSSTACSSAACAHNSQTNESFCAQICPPANSAMPCPTHMSCKRVADVFSLLP
jgi:hypothetical protein